MEQKHIVVVDDEASMRYLLKTALVAAGYRVSEARNALEAFKLGDYDLMLLDIKMPGIDGHKILSSLKRDKSGGSPVIVMSGLSDPEQRKQALAEGADAFLPKPVNMELLLTTVAELLARAPSR